MAMLSFSGLDDLAREIARAGEKAKPTVQKMLEAGGAAMEEAWKHAIDDAGLVDTGEMRASVKAGKITLTDDGGFVEVYPRGKDSRGVRNADKAFINHYGSSRIRATAFVDQAEEEGEPAATAAMEAIWNAQR